MTHHDQDLKSFIASIAFPPSSRSLADKHGANHFLKRLEMLGISTVGELWGCLNPDLPKCKNPEDLAKRGLSKGYLAKTSGSNGKHQLERRIKQLARATDCPVSRIRRLSDEIKKLPPIYQDSRPARAEWFLGQRRPMSVNQTASWQQVAVRDLHGYRKLPRSRQLVVLPELRNRLGEVWDQGERGTCVAQAAGGLIGYLAGGFTPSTQFLYHQCKMIDGLLAHEGTYLHIALQVLSDRSLSGLDRSWNSADLGVPDTRAWPYSSKFTTGNPAQTPPPKECLSAIYSSVRAFNAESKNGSARVLHCAEAKAHIVDDIRFLVDQMAVPVVAGFPLYESFNNPNSRRTGKVTLPLPGESLMGYHAMLIVGFDDLNGSFIVRNSWGASWAWNNAYVSGQTALAGHAIIPYAYFEKSGIEPVTAYSLHKADVGAFVVPEAVRLYRHPSRALLARNSIRTPQRSRRDSKPRAPMTKRASRETSFLKFLRVS